MACCSIVAPPAASPCALSICISVQMIVRRSAILLRSFQKIKNKNRSDVELGLLVVSFGVARITFHVYVD